MLKMRSTVLLVLLATACLCCNDLGDKSQEYADGGVDYSSTKDALEEVDQPISGERFVAIHVVKNGATENLNPKLVGLSNMAINFLPSDYRVVEILSATREVVNGVRYNLMVNTMLNETEPTVCAVEVLEKPWIVTQFGEKQRSLAYTNCTSESSIESSTDINENDFRFNPLFRNTGVLTDDALKMVEEQIVVPKMIKKTTTPKPAANSEFDEFMKGLEDQIVAIKKPRPVIVVPSDDSTHQTDPIQIIDTTSTTTEDPSEVEAKPLDDSSKNLLDELFNVDLNYRVPTVPVQSLTANVQENNVKISDTQEFVSSLNEVQHTITTTPVLPESNIIQDNIDSTTHEDTSSYTPVTEDLPNKNPKNEVHSDEPGSPQITKIVLSVLPLNEPASGAIANDANTFSSTSENQSNNDGQPDPVVHRRKRQSSTTEADYVREIARKSLVQLDSVDSDEHKRILLDVLRSNKQVHEGGTTEFVLAVRVANSHCVEDESAVVDESCAINLVQDSRKICNIEVRVKRNHDVTVLKSLCSPEKRSRRDVLVGAPAAASNVEVENVIKHALTGVSAQPNGKSYSLKSIESSTKQVVAGLKYKIKGKFSNGATDQECDLTVWTRPWLNEDEVTFECPDQPKYNFQMGSQPAPSSRRKRALLGAPNTVDVERSDIRPLLDAAITSISGESSGETFTIKRVINATEQLVAGTLYKIAGEFGPSSGGPTVECIVEIYSVPWLNTKEYTMKCDDTKVYKSRAKRSSRPLLDSEDTHHPYVSSHDYADMRRFSAFQTEFNRTYKTRAEYLSRMRTFKSNLRKIEALNEQEQGTAEYGVNQFADMTEAEFKQYTGLRARQANWETNDISHPLADIPDVPVPKEFDWREKNVISPVKNQGQCGSCWAFSVIGNIEGLHAIKTGQLEEYSEQELVDCDTIDSGCNGGLFDNAYKAIEQLGGLELESDYPYSAKSQQCRFNKTKVHVRVAGAVDLPQNETAMAQWLVTNGPLSIGLNANGMQFYRGGVSHPWKALCSKKNIDHGVLIVGLGVAEYPLFNKTMPYWIVKNSWGPQWGEQGYYRVFRGDNTCGLATMVSSAVLE